MLDTCVCVDILRGRVSGKKMPSTEDCRLSSIVTAELRTGLAKCSPDLMRSRKLEEFISLFEVLNFDDACSRAYAEIRANLEERGIPIGPLDLLIAAHAKAVGATLITANLLEFRRVKGLPILAWTVA